jgi:hypothetical protein
VIVVFSFSDLEASSEEMTVVSLSPSGEREKVMMSLKGFKDTDGLQP